MRGGRNLAVGYSFQATAFTRPGAEGFFTPDLAQYHSVTGRLNGRMARVLQYEFHGSLGPQKTRVFGGDPRTESFSFTGTTGGTLDWNITEATTLGGGYDYAKAYSATGAYRVHSFVVYWRMRF